MTDCDQALAAGGSPATWRRRLEPAAERLDAVDRVLRATCAWPAAPSLAGDRPLFGTTLTELTETVPARVSVRSTRSGTASVITHSPTAHPQMPRPTHAQPPAPLPEPPLRPGVRRSTAGSVRNVSGSYSVVDPTARIPTGRLRALAGDRPTTIRTAPGSPALLRRTVDRPPHPQLDPGSAAAYLDSLAAAVSRRVGGNGSLVPVGRRRQVPRPGPAAPVELLHGALLGDNPSVTAATAAAQSFAPDRVPTQVDRSVDDTEEGRPHIAPSIPNLPSVGAGRAGLGTEPAAGSTAAPGSDADQPDVPVWDRTSALAPTLAPTAEPGPAFLTGSSSSPPFECDLERLLERVLGDAARRHGIEV